MLSLENTFWNFSLQRTGFIRLWFVQPNSLLLQKLYKTPKDQGILPKIR